MQAPRTPIKNQIHPRQATTPRLHRIDGSGLITTPTTTTTTTTADQPRLDSSIAIDRHSSTTTDVVRGDGRLGDAVRGSEWIHARVRARARR